MVRIPTKTRGGSARALAALFVAAVLPFAAVPPAAAVPVYSASTSVSNPVVPTDNWLTGEITLYADHAVSTLGGSAPLSLTAPVQATVDNNGGMTIELRTNDDYSKNGFEVDWVKLEQPGEPVLLDDFNTLDTSLWRVTGWDQLNNDKPGYVPFDPSFATWSVSGGVLRVKPTTYRGGVFLYTTSRVVKHLPAKLTYRVRYPGYTYRGVFASLWSTSCFDAAGHGKFDWTQPLVFSAEGTTHHAYLDKYLWVQWPDVFKPVAEAGPDKTAAVQQTVTFDGSLSRDPDGSLVMYRWYFGDGTIASGPTATHAYAAPGVYTVKLTVMDCLGQVASDTAIVRVQQLNGAPALSVVTNSVQSLEGGTASNSGTVSDPDGDAVTLSASRGTVTKDKSGSFTWSMPTGATSDGGPVTIVASDGRGGTTSTTFDVVVANVAPKVTSVSGPATPILKGGTAKVSAEFTDPGAGDAFTASIEWGDGTSGTGAVAGTTVTGSHVYTKPGVYEVRVTVADKDGGVGTGKLSSIVVYDPSAGFVTGGGTFLSRPGSFRSDPKLAAITTFGFNAKYKKGSRVPTGETSFQLHKSMKFKSRSYEWLVVDGGSARYQGRGTINGKGDYGFLLSVTQVRPKRGRAVNCLRMRIWDTASGKVVYDNEPGSDPAAPPVTVVAGSVVVHK